MRLLLLTPIFCLTFLCLIFPMYKVRMGVGGKIHNSKVETFLKTESFLKIMWWQNLTQTDTILSYGISFLLLL